MYAIALALSAGTTAGTVGMPFFQLGSIGPIQSFGIIVAAGVLIGAALLRRYAEWHGVSDAHIRGLTGWITVTGFIGAHVFDVIAYQWNDFMKDPVLIIKLWSGISSYGGFIGGAVGFAFYVWWKRLPAKLMADIAIIGLLPAFSIGRIGCTVVSDHIGAVVDRAAWYAPLAMEYPTKLNMDAIHWLVAHHPPAAGQQTILAWNLGFIELLYLIPVNALVLWLGFRSTKRMPAGFLVVLTGVLYAPVRFFLDYLRLENTDARHAGLTFAQWSSFLAFAVAVYAAMRVFKSGKPAETVTKTSRETQEKLRTILKDDDDAKPGGKSAGQQKAMKPAKPDVDAKQTAKTEYTAGGSDKPSPNTEEPADEGAEVDAGQAIAAREAASGKPTAKPKKK